MRPQNSIVHTHVHSIAQLAHSLLTAQWQKPQEVYPPQLVRVTAQWQNPRELYPLQLVEVS